MAGSGLSDFARGEELLSALTCTENPKAMPEANKTLPFVCQPSLEDSSS